jgi:hypothetical protein
MQTSETLAMNLNPLTLSVAAFLARTSATPENEPELMENEAASGEKCSAYVAYFDHVTSSLKTSQQSLFVDYQECLAILPPSGMMQNGKVYQQPPLVRRTYDFGRSLLPTPTARETRGKDRPRKECSGPSLCEVLRRRLGVTCLNGKNGYISPNFVEYLMGFPPSWTESEV